jgi:hypothetical protein
MNTLQNPESLRQSRADHVYDEFLYAQLGEEANGVQLSVLSALARQNVDPWEIAQRLTSMPREPAILFLSPLLARICADQAGPAHTAARLIALLPSRRASAPTADFSRTAPRRPQSDSVINKMWLVVAFSLYLLFSQLLFARLSSGTTAERHIAPVASAPARAAASTPQGHQRSALEET